MSTDTTVPATDTPNAVTPDTSAEIKVQASETVVSQPSATNPPPIPVVPEKYDLKLEEGSLLDPSHVEQFESFAKEKKMTQEQAQEFLQREHKAIQSFYESQQQKFEQTKEAWKQQTISDPEIGGEKFNENIELAHRALKQFGSETFMQAIESTGYGNHPEMVRVFARIGKMMAESKIVTPGTQTGGPSKNMADIFYGDKN